MSNAPSVQSPSQLTIDLEGVLDLRSAATSCPATLDRALEIVSSGSVDVGLAFGALPGSLPETNGQISASCEQWLRATQTDTWLLVADVELHRYLTPADNYSMIRVVDERGVVVLLPRPRRKHRSTRRTTDRMCQILEIGGLAAVNVFCSFDQRRAVSARLRRHHVFAGFPIAAS